MEKPLHPYAIMSARGLSACVTQYLTVDQLATNGATSLASLSAMRHVFGEDETQREIDGQIAAAEAAKDPAREAYVRAFYAKHGL